MRKLMNASVAVTALFSCLMMASRVFGDDASEKVRLDLKLPDATVKGTPGNDPTSDGVEPVPDKAIEFMVPKGVANVALHKPVTSGTPPYNGELSQITDGKKTPEDVDAVEFKKGAQWVQVDLGASYPIYAIAMWHDHRVYQVVKDVILQVSDDPDFKTSVTTLFNNDKENAVGLGIGNDREYFESRYGKIVDGKGVKARYVRSYTKGNSQTSLNCWQEIEVYALPANN